MILMINETPEHDLNVNETPEHAFNVNDMKLYYKMVCSGETYSIEKFTHPPHALRIHQILSLKPSPESHDLLCTSDYLQLQTHKSNQV